MLCTRHRSWNSFKMSFVAERLRRLPIRIRPRRGKQERNVTGVELSSESRRSIFHFEARMEHHRREVQYNTSPRFLSIQRSAAARDRSNQNRWFYGLGALLAVPILGSETSQIKICDGNGGPKYYDMHQSATFLRKKLETFREAARQQGFKLPLIRIGEDNGTFVFQFPCPRNASVLQILTEMIPLLSKSMGENGSLEVHSTHRSAAGRSLSLSYKDCRGSVLFYQPVNDDRQPMQFGFYKDESMTEEEVLAIVAAYKAAQSALVNRSHALFDAMDGGKGRQSNDAIQKLTQLGVYVYDSSNPAVEGLSWEHLAGYDNVKEEIEDTLILALKHPDAYERIARATRKRYETNRPRAVLFEGPPGTGKTLCAKVIASRAEIPMIHVPVERIMSKWYGESEKTLSQVFDACDELGGAIIFIDEIDALVTSRDSGNMHEATRRVLSVLLQKLEGFDSKRKTVLICATNRKKDLDSALLSRFDLSILFDLPNEDTRVKIWSIYAKHLKDKSLRVLAVESDGMSARDIKEVCENTERKWASKLLRRQVTGELPSEEQYLKRLDERQRRTEDFGNGRWSET